MSKRKAIGLAIQWEKENDRLSTSVLVRVHTYLLQIDPVQLKTQLRRLGIVRGAGEFFFPFDFWMQLYSWDVKNIGFGTESEFLSCIWQYTGARTNEYVRMIFTVLRFSCSKPLNIEINVWTFSHTINFKPLVYYSSITLHHRAFKSQ